MQEVYVTQLPCNLRTLILGVAELSLRNDGYTGKELMNALDNVCDERIDVVVYELLQYIKLQLTSVQ